jgi:hypothetical protein
MRVEENGDEAAASFHDSPHHRPCHTFEIWSERRTSLLGPAALPCVSDVNARERQSDSLDVFLIFPALTASCSDVKIMMNATGHHL